MILKSGGRGLKKRILGLLLIIVVMSNYLPYTTSNAQYTPSNVQNIPQEEEEVGVEVERVQVEGTFYDEKDAPCSGKEVLFVSEGEEKIATVSEDGTFLVELQKGETYEVSVKELDTVKYKAIKQTITPTEQDKTIEIKLVLQEYSIQTSTDSKGTINNVTNKKETLNYGSSYIANIVANEGYVIEEIKIVIGDQIETVPEAVGSKNYTYTVESIGSDYEITARFAPVYAITFQNNEEGRVEVPEGLEQVGNVVYVKQGNNVKFTAIPKDNYHVSQIRIYDGHTEKILPESEWIKEGRNCSYELTNINSNYTVEVLFVVDSYQVTFQVGDNGGADINLVNADGVEQKFLTITESDSIRERKDTVISGTDIAINIKPNIGYVLKKLSITAEGSEEREITDYEASDSTRTYFYRSDNVSENITVNVEFEKAIVVEVELASYFNLIYNNNSINKVEQEGQITTYWLTPDSEARLEVKEGSNASLAIIYDDTVAHGNITYARSENIRANHKIKKICYKVNKKNPKDYFIVDTKIIIDSLLPQIQTIGKQPKQTWNNNSVVVSGTAKDMGEAGLYQVRYSNNLEEYTTDTYESNTSKSALLDSFGNYSFTVADTQQKTTYYVWAYDQCGNKSVSMSVEVSIDKSRPVIQTISSTLGASEVTNDKVTISGTFSDKVKIEDGVDQNGDITGEDLVYTLDEDGSTIVSGVSGVYYSTVVNDIGKKPQDSSSIKSAAIKGEGTFSFDTSSAEQNQEYFVWAYDNAGNVSLNYKKVLVRIDQTLPVVTEANITTEAGKDDWYRDEITIQVAARDYSSQVINAGLAEVFCTTELLNNSPGGVKLHKISVDGEGRGTFSAPLEEHREDGFNGIFYIYARDNAGNLSEPKQVTAKIDMVDPEITSIELRETNTSFWSKAINVLSFGVFCNEEIEVTVTGYDQGKSSGLNEISLYQYHGEFDTAEKSLIEVKPLEGESNQVVFTLEVPFSGNIAAMVNDNSGRASNITDANNISTILLESSKPTVEVTPIIGNGAKYESVDENQEKMIWVNKDIELSIIVKDMESSNMESGLEEVSIKLNGKEVASQRAAYGENQTFEDTFTINTSMVEPGSRGDYLCEVYVRDNAKNETTYKAIRIFKDEKAPSVTGFTLNEQRETGLFTGKEEVVYGYYYNGNDGIRVTVDVADPTPSSGIHRIEYYLDNGVKVEPVLVKDGKATFEITQDYKGSILVKVIDNLGNTQENYLQPRKVVYETETMHKETSHILLSIPNSDVTLGGSNLYNKDIEVEVEVKDTYSGISSIEWAIAEQNTKKEEIAWNHVKVDNEGQLSEAVTGWNITGTDQNLVTHMKKAVAVTNDSNDLTLYVKLTDRAGNTTLEQKSFSIDKTAPTIQVDYDNNEAYYSSYYKASRKATITITERNFDAKGVVLVTTNNKGVLPAVTKWITAKNEENPDLSTHTATIDYIAEGDYTFEIAYTDQAGNKAKTRSKETFTVDTTVPNISVNFENAIYKDGKNQHWYAKDVAFNVLASDRGAGIYTVDIIINGVSIKTDSNKKAINTKFYENRTWEEGFIINTNQVKIAEDGSYTIVITVTDNAGNQKVYEHKLFKDDRNPEIESFQYTTAGAIEADGKPVELTKYGYFFKKDTRVTITAKDTGVSAGIQSITYYTVDYSINKSGVRSKEVTVKVNERNQISFTIPANFKGQIYAKASDQVKNTPLIFVHPDGTVVENASKHAATSSITLERPNTTLRDKDGIALYNQDVTVNIAVEDLYSGIRSIEWKVTSPYDRDNNTEGILTIDYSGKIEGQKGNWKINSTDQNLVTKMSQNLAIKNNSNGIKVWVKLTDRAGNSSEKEIEFSIDKTAPVVTVQFDHNGFDPGFSRETQYFKTARTATITVKERNFRKDNVSLIITNTDRVIPSISGWREEKNAQNPDDTLYIATVQFKQDGDYTMEVGTTDLAGNKAGVVKAEPFTMDMTVPQLGVTFDNQSAKNSNYYNKTRTATITIREHNFETSRISFQVMGGENTTNLPKLSGWSTRGDVHTATITFDKDGAYSFLMDYIDKAGNEGATIKETEFNIDLTSPVLGVTGISNETANSGRNEKNEEVAIGFVIDARDENFASIKATLELITINGVTNCSDLLGAPKEVDNGKQYIVNNLDADGIYVLTCIATDKAGNVTRKALNKNNKGEEVGLENLSFSVNRNGSVYTLDETTSAVSGGYVKEIGDLVITETNVNKLVQSKVTLYNDGVTKVLKEGVDFKVQLVGSNTAWYQYVYTISKENFTQDGVYSIALYSIDEATNVSENTMDSKNVELNFAIDQSKPNIIVTDLKDDMTYSTDQKSVTMVISDNIKLDSVKVYHETYSDDASEYGEIVKEWTAEEITSMIAENKDFLYVISGDSTDRHKIKVVATDAAGSENMVEIKDFYVTTNWWINYKTNKTMVYGSIGGVAVVTMGGILLVILRKKRSVER